MFDPSFPEEATVIPMSAEGGLIFDKNVKMIPAMLTVRVI